MATHRLVLVNPVTPTRAGILVNRGARMPPLNLGMVAALTPPSWQITLIDENWERFTYRDADLVGITAFTPTANRAYQIAAHYRQRGVPVVIGGIHPSMVPQEAAQYVDTVVVGEAESAWPRVLADWEAGQLKPFYHGEWSELVGLPWPRRDLFHPGYLLATVQTSRGCPMDCDFCSVTAFNGGRYRRRPTEEVLAELETIPQKLIFFIDDNLVGYGKRSRDQALALLKGMAERKLGKWWFCQASLNFGDDPEVLYWAGRAGCRLVLLGVEAESADALADVNKRLNLSRGVASYDPAFRRIQRAGIAIMGTYIFGTDSDTPASLHRRADFMIRSGTDIMIAQLLTPLPGTRLFGRYCEQGRLRYTDFPSDWERYDMSEVVHCPRRMAPEVLAREFGAVNERLYTWYTLAYKALRTLWRTRNVMAPWIAWTAHRLWQTSDKGTQTGPAQGGRVRRLAIELALDLWLNRRAAASARKAKSSGHRSPSTVKEEIQ